MIDPEASRQTAHIFLDAAAAHHRDDPTADDVRDDMTVLALERLAAVGSIQVMQDDETGAITLPVMALRGLVSPRLPHALVVTEEFLE
jgi:hypothetical protein